MKIFVTGAAGFIGYHLCQRLLSDGHDVVGLDNINDYYDVNLKYDRLDELGISRIDAEIYNNTSTSKIHNRRFVFVRLDLEDRESLSIIFNENQFDIVVNLAAQAGVRYSLQNPEAYIDSNIVGFLNILECSRKYKIKHLLYASSSSVYGESKKVPFSTGDNVDHPISLYAATKKSNELMAHTYSHLFGLKSTGLRFFTVYGPWGRPDMAIFLFTEAINKREPIKVFNQGALSRDFTYIDDIIDGIQILLDNPSFQEQQELYRVINIGNGNPQPLENFIKAIENSLGKTAFKEYLPMQPGDVSQTWADITDLSSFGYSAKIDINLGVKKFIDWYIEYYKKKNQLALF